MSQHLQIPQGETPPPPSPVLHDDVHLAGIAAGLGETTITFPGEDKLTAKQFETKMFDSTGAIPKYDATSAANLPANIPPPLLPGQAPPDATPAPDKSNAFANITIHTVPVENVCAELKTDLVNGLSSQEHAMRLARDGPNKLTPPKELPWILKQLPHYVGGFQMLMIIGGILCLIVYFLDKSDHQTLWFGVSLIVVVVFTGTFEAYQDNQANNLMNGFKNLTESTAVVLRDGQRKTVPSLELVIGDVCILDGGMKICADLRIMESRGLKVDNSTLTGEPEPLRRQPECTSQASNETRNLAFSGTFFTEGTGKGIVYSCGDNTAIGSISASASAAKRPETTLKRELRHFVTRMAIIALLIAVTFVVVGVAKERITWKTAIIYFIVGVLANIPEGLLPQLTAQLTLVAKRMKAKNVMVKNLEIIETLGCTSCVASDKTGTLTQNRMTVAHAWFDLNIFACLHNEADRDGPLPDTTAPTFGWLQRCATLCNRAHYLVEPGEPLDIMTTPVKGDASETAMLRFVQPVRDALEYRAACPMIGEIPFNSTNKWALTIVRLEDGTTAVLMKGAPERILTRCTSIAINGEIVPMGSYSNDVVEANKALARRGERVLAFAWLPLENGVTQETINSLGEGDPPAELMLDQLCFIGLLALVDPPRVGVAESILQCQTAGIQVIMVTGDHPETARSIAKSINIMPGMTREERAEFEGVRPEQVNPEHVEAVVIHTADELPHFTQEDWDYTLSRKQVVFARSLPAQKQKIVQELQARGHVVAVTGDGTNDCPALRQAACGVAMGVSGSDIAKNAAQVVLLDDNFCSLIDGIREGRLIFHNMKKCIMYTVTHLMPEIIPFFLLILARLPLAMETAMILVIDLGTELMPAIALAWEEGEANFMSQPPRNLKTTRLVSKQLLFMAYIAAGIWETMVCYWGFFWAFSGYGFTIDHLFGYGRYWDTKESELKPAELQRYNELALLNPVWQSHTGRAAKFNNFYDFRVHALHVAQSAYIWGLVVSQLANILCCRSRYESLFSRPMNKWILVGMILAVIIINLVTYVPALHQVFGATTLPAEYIFISVPTIVIMVVCEEARKFCIRRWPKGCIAKLTDY